MQNYLPDITKRWQDQSAQNQRANQLEIANDQKTKDSQFNPLNAAIAAAAAYFTGGASLTLPTIAGAAGAAYSAPRGEDVKPIESLAGGSLQGSAVGNLGSAAKAGDAWKIAQAGNNAYNAFTQTPKDAMSSALSLAANSLSPGDKDKAEMMLGLLKNENTPDTIKKVLWQHLGQTLDPTANSSPTPNNGGKDLIGQAGDIAGGALKAGGDFLGGLLPKQDQSTGSPQQPAVPSQAQGLPAFPGNPNNQEQELNKITYPGLAQPGSPIQNGIMAYSKLPANLGGMLPYKPDDLTQKYMNVSDATANKTADNAPPPQTGAPYLSGKAPALPIQSNTNNQLPGTNPGDIGPTINNASNLPPVASQPELPDSRSITSDTSQASTPASQSPDPGLSNTEWKDDNTPSAPKTDAQQRIAESALSVSMNGKSVPITQAASAIRAKLTAATLTGDTKALLQLQDEIANTFANAPLKAKELDDIVDKKMAIINENKKFNQTASQQKQNHEDQMASQAASRAIAERRLNVTINNQSSGAGGLTEKAKDLAAQNFLMTGQTMPGMGNAKTRIEIMNRAAELGYSQPEIANIRTQYDAYKMSLKKLQTQYDQIKAYENAAQSNLSYMMTLAKKYDKNQTSIPAINNLINKAREASGKGDIAGLNAATYDASNEVLKVIKGSTGGSAASTDAASKEMQKVMSLAQSYDQKSAVVQAEQIGMSNRARGLTDQISQINQKINGLVTPKTNQPTIKIKATNEKQGDNPIVIVNGIKKAVTQDQYNRLKKAGRI